MLVPTQFFAFEVFRNQMPHKPINRIPIVRMIFFGGKEANDALSNISIQNAMII
jgi:hypothetical protein